MWNGKVLATSKSTITIENNTYFPPESIHKEFFKKSDHHTTCPWKGLASYYHIEVDGLTNKNAAWYYPEPKAAAAEIKSYVAFWHGVEVVED